MKLFPNLIVILIAILCSFAKSEENDISFKYGFGFNHTTLSNAESILVSLSYIRHPSWLKIISEKYEMGFWTDSRSDLGRKDSGFGSYSLGVRPQWGVVYAEAMVGAALITTPDTILGGHFQFSHDFGIGVRDKKGLSIGINYKHLSDAGIVSPNLGRDFVLINLGFMF